MIERTTVRLPQELLNRARKKAAAEGRTLTALMEDGLRFIVEDQPKQKPTKRRLPRVDLPVSKATGGFKPGFENLTYSQIEELEDLEYIERLKNGFK